MKRGIIYLLLVVVAASLSSCSDKKRSANLVFMPDMYYPVAYDPYMEANFEYPKDEAKSEVPLFAEHRNMTALWPVEGTVSRTEGIDILPWELKNTLDDYEKSRLITTSPLNPSDRREDLKRGELLYSQTCVVCHGASGDGQGSIVQTKAYSGVPNFVDREISVGSVYQVIMYGKNAMGSYSSQLNEIDRWRVAEYVMNLRAKNFGETTPSSVETSESNQQ